MGYIEEVREKFQYELRMTCYSVFVMDENVVKSCDKIIDAIEQLMSKYSSDELEQILGGTFAFGNYHSKDCSIPLYLYMELLGESVYKKYTTEANRASMEKLRTRFMELRDKLIGFNQDKIFDYNKHVNGELIKNLIDSNGHLRITTDDSYGLATIHSKVVRESFRQRPDGEYVPVGKPSETICSCLLYEEDKQVHYELVEKENQALRKKFDEVAGKYFKNRLIPNYVSGLESSLVSKDIHWNIKHILQLIVESRASYEWTASGQIQWMKENEHYLRGILMLEKTVEEEKVKENAEQVHAETLALLNRYHASVNVYFKNNTVPRGVANFESHLIDENVPSSIQFMLYRLVEDRAHYSYDMDGELQWMQKNLALLEKIEQERLLTSQTENKRRTRKSRREALEELSRLVKELMGFNIGDTNTKKGKR